MGDMQSSSSFSERMRRIRFRRSKETTRFRDELRIIPKWLIGLILVLFISAQIGFIIGNFGFHAMSSPEGTIWPYPSNGLLSGLCVAGIVAAGSIPVSVYLLLLGYVYRDAKRRDMNPVLWTILVMILSPGTALLGFIVYFLLREPLPYHCPQCAATVGARFNFCPNCKFNLRPTCPQCKREVGELDKFCPYCACDLTSAGVTASPSSASLPNAAPDFRGS
jgi:hypothetical protein